MNNNRIHTLRYHWIDNLKFFALFLVVFGHIGTSPLHDIIYGFHMPLFFFLSGMLHKDKPLKNSCTRLLIPYLLLNTFFLLVEFPWLYRQNNNLDFVAYDFWGIIFPQEHPIDYPTWFLLSLFEIKLALKVLKNEVLLSLIVALLTITICCFLNSDFNAPFFFQNSLIGLVYYDLGYLMYRSFNNEFIKCKHPVWCISGGVISIALYIVLMVYIPSCVWNEAIGHPFQLLYSLLACCGFVWLFYGAFNNGCNIIEQSCMGGIAIIGFHPLFIQYLRRFIQLLGVSWGDFSLIETLLLSIVVMDLCIVTIPLVRKHFPLLIGLNK